MIDDWSAASFGMKKSDKPIEHEKPEGLTTNETPGKLVPKKPPHLQSSTVPGTFESGLTDTVRVNRLYSLRLYQ